MERGREEETLYMSPMRKQASASLTPGRRGGFLELSAVSYGNSGASVASTTAANLANLI